MFFFFFFSSRRRHTRYWRDWSSDVCSSDLGIHALFEARGLVLQEWDKVQTDLLTIRETDAAPPLVEIGRASCRERVEIWVVGVAVKKKENRKREGTRAKDSQEEREVQKQEK